MKAHRTSPVSLRTVFVLILALVFSAAAWAIAPGNDNTGQGFAIQVGGFPYLPPQAIPGTNVDATLEVGEITPTSQMQKTVWYSYTPAHSGWLTADTNGASFDTMLAVFRTGTPSVLAWDDDTGTGSASLVSWYVEANVTYNIQAGGYAGAQGSFTLSLAWAQPSTPTALGTPPVVADAYAQRVPLLPGSPAPLTRAFTLVGATLEAGEPAPVPVASTVWFRWTAPAAGQLVVRTQPGIQPSPVDTVLALYQETPALPTAAALVASNDDFGGPSSQITVTVVAGQSYALQVSRYGGVTAVDGSILMDATFFPPFQASVISASIYDPTMIDGDPEQGSFRGELGVMVSRLENITLPVSTNPFQVAMQLTLTDTTTSLPVPLEQSSITAPITFPSHSGTTPPTAVTEQRYVPLSFRPAVGTRLIPSHSYVLTVATSVINAASTSFPAGQTATDPRRLLQLNGILRPLNLPGAQFTLLRVRSPEGQWTFTTPVNTLPATSTQFAVDAGDARWQGLVNVTTDAASFTGSVLADGTVTYDSGPRVTIAMPEEIPVIQTGLHANLTGLSFDQNGMYGTVRLKLPTGSGVAVNNASRRCAGSVILSESPLSATGAPLAMTSRTISVADVKRALGHPFTLADESDQNLWFTSEEYPVRIHASSVVWDSTQGKIILTPTGAADYVLNSSLASIRVSITNGVLPAGSDFVISNQGVWANATVSSPTVVVRRHPSTEAAETSMNLALGATEFTPHFPLSAPITCTGGQLTMVQSQIDRAQSFITGVGLMTAYYSRASGADPCLPPGSLPAMSTFQFTPTAGKLSFTTDGGLSADATLSAPHLLEFGLWNSPVQTVHRLTSFTKVQYLMAGGRLRGSVPLANSIDGAAALLYSGHTLATQPEAPERPGTAAYTAGLGNYPGFNFRVAAGTVTGLSHVAREPVSAGALANRCKYNARFGGVTGMIQPQTFSALPINFYGNAAQLTDFQLSFIDNLNVESYINGGLTFTGPAGFNLNFERMKLKGNGDLAGAEIAAGQAGKRLAYWGITFDPLVMDFTAGSCVGSGVLPKPVVTMVASLPGVTTQKLTGSLAFDSSGDIDPGADGKLGRIELPANLKMKGPGVSEWALRPVSSFILNKFALSPDASGGYASSKDGKGFGSFFATIDVPYFEDMKAHIQVETARTRAPWFVTNGNALKENGKTAFESQRVDLSQRSFVGPSLENYREPTSNAEGFPPLASKKWLGMIDFNFPMSWDAQEKIFVTPPWLSSTADLKVMKIGGQIDRLSPGEADISFGASFSGIPRLNTKALVSSALEDGLGLASVVQNAASDVLKQPVYGNQTFDAFLLTGSVDRLNKLVSDRLTQIIDQTLGQAVFNASGAIYDTIKGEYDTNSATAADGLAYLFGQNGQPGLFDTTFATVNGTITTALQNANNGVNSVNGLLNEVNSTLTQAKDGITEVRKLLQRPADLNPQLPRPIFSELIQKIVKSPQIIPPGKGVLAGVSSAGQDLVDAVTNALKAELLKIANDIESGAQTTITSQYRSLLADAEPTLSDVDRRLADLQELITDLQDAISSNTGPLVAQIQTILTDTTKYQAAIGAQILAVKDDIKGQITTALNDGHQWFLDHPRAEVQQMLRRRVVDAIVGSPMIQQVQTIIRNELKKVETKLQEAIDSLFAEVNRIIKPIVAEGLKATLSLVNTPALAQAKKALEDKAAKLDGVVNEMGSALRKTIGGGEIKGHASINDESLRRLRVDGKFALMSGKKAGADDAPTPGSTDGKETLELTAFFEFNEHDSTGPPTCGTSPSGGPEIAFGATCPIAIPIPKGASPSQKIIGFAEARISLSSSGIPEQLSGKVGFKGELQIAELSVIDPLVTLGFGLRENYIGAKVRAKLNSIDISASLLLGQVCDYTRLKALGLLDKDTIRYFETVTWGTGKIIGLYAGGEGRKNLIDGPETCLLKLVGGIGVGAFVMGSSDVIVVGARLMASVEGEVLCIARVKGELGLAGGISISIPEGEGVGEAFKKSALTLVGRLDVEGEIGYCPFCIDFSKSFGVVLIVGPNRKELKIDL